jgi:hypothetical protein
MKNHTARWVLIVFLAIGTGAFMNLVSASALAQDDDANVSSRRETAAIEAVEKAGGRVYRISNADTTREVSFYLAAEPVGDEQLKGLSAINEVIWLNLAGSKVTAKGLKEIEGMKLQKLHLEKSTITDKAMEIVKKQKELVYLNLYSTAVTDKGLEQLAEMKNLRKLYVWQSKVTEAGIEKLQEKLPDLKIVGECKLVVVPAAEPEKKEEAKEEGEGKSKENDTPKEETQEPKKEEAKDGEADQKKPEEDKKED